MVIGVGLSGVEGREGNVRRPRAQTDAVADADTMGWQHRYHGVDASNTLCYGHFWSLF